MMGDEIRLLNFGERLHGKTLSMWKENIKINVKETGYIFVHYVQQARDSVRWRILVSLVLSVWD
jgi:hypothetical protein